MLPNCAIQSLCNLTVLAFLTCFVSFWFLVSLGTIVMTIFLIDCLLHGDCKVIFIYMDLFQGFPGGSDGKEPACNVGDLDSIPELGRSPGGRHGNPRQYSCLESPRTEKTGGPQSMGSQRVGHD